MEWQTGVVVPIFKKDDQRVCSNYRGITLLSLPGKVYSRVLERRLQPIVEPQIQEGQCGFCQGCETVDQLFTLAGLLGGAWEFAHPVYMCFVDLEKAYDRVPRGVQSGVLREYGVPGLLLRAIRSLYNQSESCVHILCTSQARFQWVLASTRVVPCHRFCLSYSWTGSQGAAGGRRVSGLGTSELHLCYLQMMWFCWLHHTVTSSTHWGGLQPSVKR